MKIEPTPRGFMRADFSDRYGAKCSIQESSLATEDALWLGCNEGSHHRGQCSARMHLTREMAATLIPLLQHFVDTGYLPRPPEPDESACSAPAQHEEPTMAWREDNARS